MLVSDNLPKVARQFDNMTAIENFQKLNNGFFLVFAKGEHF